MSDWLTSTTNLVSCAFPDGLRGEEYYATLHILDQYMGQRNLADVIASFTRIPFGRVYNDVLGAADPRASAEVLERVRARLDACGFEQWIAEP